MVWETGFAARAVCLVAITAGLLFIAPLAHASSGTFAGSTQILDSSGGALPNVAADSSGDAVGIWSAAYNTAPNEAAYRAAGSNTYAAFESLPSSSGGEASIGLDGSGNAIAAWADPNETMVDVATRPSVGSWSSPTALVSSSQVIGNANVAVDDAGDAVVAFQVYDSGTSSYKLEAAVRPHGASAWSVSTVTSSTYGLAWGGYNVWSVAIDSSGRALIVWAAPDPTDSFSHSIEVSSFDGTSWGAPQQLNSSAGSQAIAENPVVAMDEGGDAVVAWVQHDYNDTTKSYAPQQVIYAATRSSTGAWGAAEALTASDEPAYYPRAAIAGGNAIVGWWRNVNVSAGNDSVAQAAIAPAGSGFTTPQTIGSMPGNSSGYQVQVAIDRSGNAVSVFRASGVVYGSTQPAASGGWSTPVQLSTASNAINPQLAVAPSGEGAALWDGSLNGKPVIEAVAYSSGASGAPAGITSPDHTIFTAGSAGSFMVTSTGSPTPSLSESGALPSGVSFHDNGDGTGSLSGTPATGSAGSYLLTITAHNGVGSDATQQFMLTVDQPMSNPPPISPPPSVQPPSISSTDHTTFAIASAGTFTVTSFGTPTPTVSESGVLPAGVSFHDNGDGSASVSGTPAVGWAGSYHVTITAHNGVGADATQSFTLVVGAPSCDADPDVSGSGNARSRLSGFTVCIDGSYFHYARSAAVSSQPIVFKHVKDGLRQVPAPQGAPSPTLVLTARERSPLGQALLAWQRATLAQGSITQGNTLSVTAFDLGSGRCPCTHSMGEWTMTDAALSQVILEQSQAQGSAQDSTMTAKITFSMANARPPTSAGPRVGSLGHSVCASISAFNRPGNRAGCGSHYVSVRCQLPTYGCLASLTLKSRNQTVGEGVKPNLVFIPGGQSRRMVVVLTSVAHGLRGTVVITSRDSLGFRWITEQPIMLG